MRKRVLLRLTGRVQGVGFRDHVLRIADGFPIAGYVRNVRTDQALEIDVEGDLESVERFLETVLGNPPPAGRIDAHTRRELEPLDRERFVCAPTTET